MQYLLDHWTQISAALVSIVGGARVLVKLLPDPKIDTAFEQFVDILKHIGLSVDPVSDAKLTPTAVASGVTVVAAPSTTAK